MCTGPTEFHEQAQCRRSARPAIRPEHDVVRVGVTPALEEVEEQVTGFDVYISCVSTVNTQQRRRVSASNVSRTQVKQTTHRTSPSQNCESLMRTLCAGKFGCRSVVYSDAESACRSSNGEKRPASYEEAERGCCTPHARATSPRIGRKNLMASRSYADGEHLGNMVVRQTYL